VGTGVTHFLLYPILAETNFITLIKTANVSNHNTVASSCNHCCAKNNKYYILWVCVCSLRYPAYDAHAPHCHRWPARLYYMFPHYLIKDTIFKKKVTENECFDFLCSFCLKHFSF